jgi:hypothetical protein
LVYGTVVEWEGTTPPGVAYGEVFEISVLFNLSKSSIFLSFRTRTSELITITGSHVSTLYLDLKKAIESCATFGSKKAFFYAKVDTAQKIQICTSQVLIRKW